MPLLEQFFSPEQRLQFGLSQETAVDQYSEVVQEQWSLEAIAALVQRLMKTGWKRLPCEDVDPLSMLFNQGVKQWTAGWDPRESALYLLLWSAESWNDKATWFLYQNGRLIFKGSDHAASPLSRTLHQLLESPRLPHISVQAFMKPLVDNHYPLRQRQIAAEQLLNTILACPEIWDALKTAFFSVIESALEHGVGYHDSVLPGPVETSLADTLALQQLASKNILVDCFRQLMQAGLLRNSRDRVRLHEALNRLQESFLNQGYSLAPMVQQAYWESYHHFRSILTLGNWRLKLAFSL